LLVVPFGQRYFNIACLLGDGCLNLDNPVFCITDRVVVLEDHFCWPAISPSA
jgi:hypothetical protein